MRPIPTLWQKRLSWVPLINIIVVFIRMIRSFRNKPIWKPYLKECILLFLSNAVLTLPTGLLRLLFPQASTVLLLLLAWLTPVIYVHASIWAQEHPGWLRF